MITDPPEIAPAFDRDNCESLLFALDLETCKGATLHVRIFKNSILDTSTKLSDRFAELFKHATRLLGRPEYAKPIQLTEKKFGLDMFYRKTSSSED